MAQQKASDRQLQKKAAKSDEKRRKIENSSELVIQDTHSTPAEVVSEKELPKGWEERKSKKSGKVYYVNENLGKTQWERPTAAQGQAERFLQKLREDENERVKRRREKEVEQRRIEEEQREAEEERNRPFWAKKQFNIKT